MCGVIVCFWCGLDFENGVCASDASVALGIFWNYYTWYLKFLAFVSINMYIFF